MEANKRQAVACQEVQTDKSAAGDILLAGTSTKNGTDLNPVATNSMAAPLKVRGKRHQAVVVHPFRKVTPRPGDHANVPATARLVQGRGRKGRAGGQAELPVLEPSVVGDKNIQIRYSSIEGETGTQTNFEVGAKVGGGSGGTLDVKCNNFSVTIRLDEKGKNMSY